MTIRMLNPLMFNASCDEAGNPMLTPRKDPLLKGWDAADALAEGWTPAHIRLLAPEQFVNYGVPERDDAEASAQPDSSVKNPAKQKKGKKRTSREHVDAIVGTFSGHLQYISGEPYAYTDGYWPRINETVYVTQKIAHYLGKDVTKASISNLLALVSVFQARDEVSVAPDMNLICLRNGTLDTRTGQLIEHSHTHNLKSQISCYWDTSVGCDRWIQFLDEIFVDDADKEQKIQFIKEWFGYCLTPDNRQHKFLWMVGAGGNGKSVLLDMLSVLVGRSNVSDAHIERLGDKFVRAELQGKLINISAEMGAEATISDGYLKSIVAGDVIEAERKFKPSFSFIPYVKLIGATNHLPRLLDLSEGFFRRAIVLKFNRNFGDTERDPHLKDKLMSELSGILAWSVEGLGSLRERGHFDIPASSVQALMDYKQDSDPDRMFFDECLIIDPAGGGMAPDDIYAGYVQWCRSSGYKSKAKANFGKRLSEWDVPFIRGHSGKRWLVLNNPDAVSIWLATGILSPRQVYAPAARSGVATDDTNYNL